jgi:DnaK suppressor protein
VSAAARSVKEAVAKTGVAKGSAQEVTVANEAAAKHTAAKHTSAKETVAKETVVKEPIAKKTAPKGTVARDAVVKEAVVKEAVVKETVAKGAKAPAKVVAKEGPAGPAPAGTVEEAVAEAPKVKRAHPAPKKTGGADGAAGRATDHGEPRELFLEHQRGLLMAERRNYTRQAEELRAQAEALALEHEPGDVQFDEEGGEGGTSNVDRELDLHLSAQAHAAIEEIDAALDKITAGTYGFCESCGSPVPKARLEALPHARLCVSCKSGGLSARRQ